MNKIIKLDMENKVVKFETVKNDRQVFVEWRGMIPPYLGGGICGNVNTKVNK